MTDVSPNRFQEKCKQPAILGIWRLGEVIHQSSSTQLLLAQPADAAGSPRWDYVVKRARSGTDHSEGSRQILQSIAAASCVSLCLSSLSFFAKRAPSARGGNGARQGYVLFVSHVRAARVGIVALRS